MRLPPQVTEQARDLTIIHAGSASIKFGSIGSMAKLSRKTRIHQAALWFIMVALGTGLVGAIMALGG